MTTLFNKSEQTEKRQSLRKVMPPAEALLWTMVRDRQLNGLKIRRQYSGGPFVLDFYCPARKLGIELDGDSHSGDVVEAYDLDRQSFIESHGIRVLRFRNEQVLNRLDEVLEIIERAANE